MRQSTAILLTAMVAGFAVLSSLGFWQLNRLTWKENLIAKVEGNLATGIISIETALAAAKADEDTGVDYRPVKILGEYVNAEPIYEFTTYKGLSGWNVFSLFKLANPAEIGLKSFAVINRGFINYDKRVEFELLAVPNGEVEVAGLLRSPPTEQPSAAYDNDIQKRIFYWRDISAMAGIWGNEIEIEKSWYIDEGMPGAKLVAETTPIPGTTLINFPNSHLQYAFTWFGLAFALLGVGSYFLYSRRNNNQ